MQTNFTPDQLRDPQLRESEQILRSCVHCGFCTATCPTYVLLGDELDSPRGRIYLMKDMLEAGRPATPDVVKHIDRCLSCLACMTTCPSGVNYMHLVDHGRAYIEKTYRRPASERLLRAALARVLPDRRLFRAALGLARLASGLAPLLRFLPQGDRLAAMLALAPARLPQAAAPSVSRLPAGQARARVALLQGCAQSVLAPSINEAAARLLNRAGVEVVTASEGCCGALVHHLGKEELARAQARQVIDAWIREIEAGGLDAIVITASGCGTTIKDYGFLFRTDAAYAEKAARVSALAKDITEFLAEIDLPPSAGEIGSLVVAYHSACSMQHGQKIVSLPSSLLARMGFSLRAPAEGHLCCGSAGTYNMLQPELACELGMRKAKHVDSTGADIIAAGNLGCLVQIALYSSKPTVHTVELLDWATGGPVPPALSGLTLARFDAPEKSASPQAATESNAIW